MMDSHQIFARLAAIAACAGVLAALGMFIERARKGSWSRSVTFFATLLFFFIPARALFHLLSRPLAEHSVQSLWLHVAVIVIWMAAGAASAFRSFRADANRAERPASNNATGHLPKQAMSLSGTLSDIEEKLRGSSERFGK